MWVWVLVWVRVCFGVEVCLGVLQGVDEAFNEVVGAPKTRRRTVRSARPSMGKEMKSFMSAKGLQNCVE